MYQFDGKTYYEVDGNIVDNRNILVCSEIANKICEVFGIVVKTNAENSQRVDTVYLNSLIKARAKQEIVKVN